MKKIIAVLAATIMLTACTPKPSQNQYYAGEAGFTQNIEHARVVSVKKVSIQNKTTGLGAGGGAAAGFAAGAQVGNGDGQVIAALGGAIVGAILGEMAEQDFQNQGGYKYVVTTKSGKTKSIVQHQDKDDVVFKKGDRVMIETNGEYQRVLPLD